MDGNNHQTDDRLLLLYEVALQHLSLFAKTHAAQALAG